jgi:hypothetical protein
VRVYDNANEKWRRIEQKTQEWLDFNYPQWVSADAAPPRWYVYDLELDEFILYPKASSDYYGDSGGDVEIYNSIKPTVMSADGSSPDLPEQLHKAVPHYLVATGLEARGYQDIANVHWAKYERALEMYQTQRDWEQDEEIIMIPHRGASY